jgi:RNA-directed DNA polymerase
MNNSDSSANQTRGDGVGRENIKPALDKLMERILERDNLLTAWAKVKANRGAAGSDGMTIGEFPDYAKANWAEIRPTLEDGTYQPQPVRQVVIPKPRGGERKLGVPCVVDRVIQQAMLQVLSPIFEEGFSPSSYGSRPKRSAHGAIRQVKTDIKAGYRVAVEIDIEKFFDNVNHDILMNRIAQKVTDKGVLGLIGRYLRAGVMVGSTIEATEWGTPQGSPLSALLANILLDDLDKELEARGHRFVRYMDDLIIMVKSKRAGQRVLAKVSQYLSRKLKLKVNEQKSRVVRTDQIEFLGFTFRGIRIWWTDQAYRDFKHRLRGLTSRSWGVSMEYRRQKLNQYLRGWMHYYGISQHYSPIEELDGWLRRRIRMCYWKQWRRPRTRIANLLKLGTTKRQAILTGISRKGYWRLSKTLATQTGMTNKWLQQQGWLSVREVWMKVQGYV